MDWNQNVFEKLNNFESHKNLFETILNFFHQDADIDAAFVSGSLVTGHFDRYSDLDLGFVCRNQEALDKVWQSRWDWNIAPWFHRMDADHVKPYFIIYLFEPDIHVDLAFYTLEKLPNSAGGPFAVAFDKINCIAQWLEVANTKTNNEPDWSNVVHEDERFWTWLHYSWCHTSRGEYYDDASTFQYLRGILEEWYARLNGNVLFNPRRLEMSGGQDFADSMGNCFPGNTRESLKVGFQSLIENYSVLWNKIDETIAPKWTTTPAARKKIRSLINNI